MYNGGQCRHGFPPETTPFFAALVLSALPGLSVLHCTSVSVLMFIMPPVKIYIKSYNAARSHASNQSSEKDTKDADVNSLLPSYKKSCFFIDRKKAKRTRHFLQHCLKFLSLAENQKCISNFCNWF